VGQLANQRINLMQGEGRLRTPLQIAAHEAVFVDTQFERRRAGFLDGRKAKLFGQSKHTQHAAHAQFSLFAMNRLAERAGVTAGALSSRQQLPGRERGSLRIILIVDAVAAALLAAVLAQELAGAGIEQADVEVIPLDVDQAADAERAGGELSWFCQLGLAPFDHLIWPHLYC